MSYLRFLYTSIMVITMAFGALFASCNKGTGEVDSPVITIPDGKLPPITGTPLKWGYDDAGSSTDRPDATSAVSKKLITEFGFDLVVHHYLPAPKYDVTNRYFQRLHDFYTDLGVNWILNLEVANNSTITFVDEKGVNWFNHPDGRRYFQIPEELLESLSFLENKPGIMYDEPEHVQNIRHIIHADRVDIPYMMSDAQAGASLGEAADNFTKQAKKIAELHAKYGLDVYTEHVFPIQFHTYARGGFIPVSKILKEGLSPAYIASALGAALQYDKPFWLTPDLWHLGTFPGHSVDTYRSALLLAYHMGAEAIYTENLSHNQNNKGGGGLILLNEARDNYKVTPYGEAALWFRKSYAPENPRHYTHKELKPRVAIIRQEDASWGQSNAALHPWLFGIKEWKSNATTEAWLQLWHLLSRGKISQHSISWHNRDVRPTPYQIFYPLDGVVVFDHHVRMPHLKDVELIFLTGIGVTQPTLNDVIEKVKQGATCVALPHLAPPEVRSRTGNNGTITEGKGRWIVTESFLGLTGSPHLEPFLPSDNHIRYRFGDTEVKFTPAGANNNKIEVSVKEIN